MEVSEQLRLFDLVESKPKLQSFRQRMLAERKARVERKNRYKRDTIAVNADYYSVSRRSRK
jgi:hypothetical protein